MPGSSLTGSHESQDPRAPECLTAARALVTLASFKPDLWAPGSHLPSVPWVCWHRLPGRTSRDESAGVPALKVFELSLEADNMPRSLELSVIIEARTKLCAEPGQERKLCPE